MEIKICMGSSCFARGNDRNLEFIEKYIKENNLHAQIELTGSRCEGKCACGPNIIINNTEYTNVTCEKIQEILGNLHESTLSCLHAEK